MGRGGGVGLKEERIHTGRNIILPFKVCSISIML